MWASFMMEKEEEKSQSQNNNAYGCDAATMKDPLLTKRPQPD